MVIQTHKEVISFLTVRKEARSIIHMRVLSEYAGLWLHGRASVTWSLLLEETQPLPFPLVAYQN